MKREKPLSIKQAREENRLDEFAEQQKGKADVPAPKARARFERLLEEMAKPKKPD